MFFLFIKCCFISLVFFTGCTPEVVMDFNKGVIEDQSVNKIPCGIEGVVSLSNLAYFNGASRIIFWRYTNFDFQRSITLKFRFQLQSQSRNAPHPLVTNCGTGHDEPSFGVILNSFSDVLTFFVKTTDSEIKFITFKINVSKVIIYISGLGCIKFSDQRLHSFVIKEIIHGSQNVF